jgi:hypothetical protein
MLKTVFMKVFKNLSQIQRNYKRREKIKHLTVQVYLPCPRSSSGGVNNEKDEEGDPPHQHKKQL